MRHDAGPPSNQNGRARTRREFLQLSGSAAAGMLASRARAATESRIEAVAFDAFPIFDARPVVALAESLFPGRGAELASAWRTSQFEYQWLRAFAGRYADFWQTTDEALVAAARRLQLGLDSERRERLMQAYLALKAWPDVAPVLGRLKQSGVRLALLSNMTEEMLEAGIANSGLERAFDHVLSTDRIRSYKPDPRAYRMGTEAFGLARERIAFAAFAGWDVAGAKWFGYPTFWVNRAGVSREELGTEADAEGRDLVALEAFVAAPTSRR